MDSVKTARNQKPTIKLGDLSFTPVLIAILVVLITIAIYFLWKKKSFKKTDALLVGLCESGKTLLFSQLLFNEFKDTFTSIAENVGEYINEENGKSVRVVDIPGHERLRLRFFDQYKNSAKGIIFLVDSVTVQKDIRDVADFLYTILADSSTTSTPILILCNKQDETLAKSSTVIKSLLEKEINLVRTTRQSQLQSVDNSASDQVFIGKQGKEFEFTQLTQNVKVAECSAQKCELDDVTAWVQTLF